MTVLGAGNKSSQEFRSVCCGSRLGHPASEAARRLLYVCPHVRVQLFQEGPALLHDQPQEIQSRLRLTLENSNGSCLNAAD